MMSNLLRFRTAMLCLAALFLLLAAARHGLLWVGGIMLGGFIIGFLWENIPHWRDERVANEIRRNQEKRS